MSGLPKFTDLYFGEADSKNEATRHPAEFMRSFVEPQNTIERIRARRVFVVLGPKGTGKSALAWYMELGRPSTEFVDVRDVSEFPLTEVDRIKTGEDPGISRSLTAWKLLLLCAVLDLILKDESSQVHQIGEMHKAVRVLRRYGFMDSTPTKAVLSATKSTFKIPVPTLGEVYSAERASEIHLHNIVPFLEKWVSSSIGSNQHTIILDGLDSIYLNDPQYFSAVSSLVQATYLLNQQLRQANSTAHVVLLMRNDVFSRLSLADAGKIQEDFAEDLDWRILTGRPERARLFHLASQKAASLSDTPVPNIVASYFPRDIQVGGRSGAPKWINTYRYLLELTRHTPRDLLRLFEYIRQEASNDSRSMTPSGALREDVIKEGASRYALKYFVTAVRNELVGRGDEGAELARAAISSLKTLARHTFTMEEFTVKCFGDQSHESIAQSERILTWLFYAGALGNHVGGSRESYLQFYHRREETDIYLKGKLALHNALMHAWNIHW